MTEILNKLEQINKYNARDITAELTEILNCWDQIKENRKKQSIRLVRHTTLWGQSTNIDSVERAGDAFVQFLTRKTIAENGYVAIRRAFVNVLMNSSDQCNIKEFKLDSKQLQAYALEPGMFWYIMYLLSIFLTPVVSCTLFVLFLHMPGLAIVGLGVLTTVCVIAAVVCAGFAEQWRYSYYSNKFLTAINNETQTHPAIVEAGETYKVDGSDCAVGSVYYYEGYNPH